MLERRVKRKANLFLRTDKLWVLLRLALNDLLLAEKEGCDIDMTRWYDNHGPRCGVCLAGAVMRARLPLPAKIMRPTQYGHFVALKMYAIDCLRKGEIGLAGEWVGETVELPDRAITSYHEDRDLFVDEIKTLIRDLRRLDV